MSEEKINVKELTVSQAVDLFLEGKIPKNDIKAFDKRSLFELNSRRLEKVLYAQRENSSMFPKKLKIKSSDIVHEYGRTLSAGQIMNLADKGFISETDLLKALKKTKVITVLAVVDEKNKKVDSKDNKEDKKDNKNKKDKVLENKLPENNEDLKKVELIPEIPEPDLKQEDVDEPVEFNENDILTKQDVAKYFSADKLLKMFFAKKMTKEFIEVYEETFKEDTDINSSRSKKLIEKLKEIFQDNLQALYIIIMRLHFRGMVFAHDIEETIKAEFFREKIYEHCDEYDVVDKDGNVIYSYKRTKSDSNDLNSEIVETGVLAIDETPKADNSVETDELAEDSEIIDSVPETEEYFILEPLTKDEIIEAYNGSAIDNDLFRRIFTQEELLEMYKNKKVTVKVFCLFDDEKKKSEILKSYNEGYIHLKEIMELFFYYDGISAQELKSIIKELPKKVVITRFITINTGFKKIFELYKNRLIDFSVLCLLKDEEYITLEQFEDIRGFVDKDEFYNDIKGKTFYTRKEDVEESAETVVEISDAERVLLTKVLGVSEEEIQNISIINSKDENGQPTMLDGYQIISHKEDGLVILGKFDFVSPIIVMTYEEAAYFLRSRDDENKTYIYDDLMFIERLEKNDQVRVVEHDENMGKNIIQAVCSLSENAKDRYSDEKKYEEEIKYYLEALYREYVGKFRDPNNM